MGRGLPTRSTAVRLRPSSPAQLERFEVGRATFPARYTLELMRPVPLTPLRIDRRVVRQGKKVQLVQGSLFADEVEVVRATLAAAA